MSNNRALFGAASEGGGSKIKNFNLEDGDNVYRIGPAYGSLAASGKWFTFIKTHYGYRSQGDETNPNGYVRTFMCPQDKDRKTDMVRVPCPECDLIEEVASTVEAREAQMQADGKSEEQIKTVLGPHKQFLKEHNLSKRYIVLAKNQQNEWGVLWLPYKAKEALDNRRKTIRADDNTDILAIEDGAWVNFHRSGQKLQTT